MDEVLIGGEPLRISQKTQNAAHLSVDISFRIHCELGPGLLESAYESCFAHELSLIGLPYERQRKVPLHYKGLQIESGYRADFLIDQELLVEIKTVDQIIPIHQAQLITYLKLLRKPLGLLINFNEVLIKDGIHRILNVNRKRASDLNE